MIDFKDFWKLYGEIQRERIEEDSVNVKSNWD